MPPIPHIAVAGQVEEQEKEEEEKPGKAPFWKKKIFQYIGSGVLLLLVIAFKFGWGVLTQTTSDTIRDKINKKPDAPVAQPKDGAPKAPAPKATGPAPTPTTPAGGKAPDGPNKATQTPGLSPTQNDIAHAPSNAVKKAQDVVDIRRNNDQTKAGDITAGADPSTKPAQPEKPAEKASVGVATSIGAGVSAPTSDVQAVAEASAAFRSFIATAKITGVIAQQGRTPLMTMNNKVIRAGETVDAGLGITFEGLDIEKKQIVFKDKTGATVTRRY